MFVNDSDQDRIEDPELREGAIRDIVRSIGSAVASVDTLKTSITVRKNVIGRTSKGYISPIWGEDPSNRIVTKFGTTVSFLDVILNLNLNLSVDGLEKLGFLDAHIWPVVIQSRLE